MNGIGRFDVFFPNPAEYTNNWMVSQGWGIQRKFAKNVFYNLQLGITENFFKVNSNIEFRLQPLINGSIFIKI